MPEILVICELPWPDGERPSTCAEQVRGGGRPARGIGALGVGSVYPEACADETTRLELGAGVAVGGEERGFVWTIHATTKSVQSTSHDASPALDRPAAEQLHLQRRTRRWGSDSSAAQLHTAGRQQPRRRCQRRMGGQRPVGLLRRRALGAQRRALRRRWRTGARRGPLGALGPQRPDRSYRGPAARPRLRAAPVVPRRARRRLWPRGDPLPHRGLRAADAGRGGRLRAAHTGAT